MEAILTSISAGLLATTSPCVLPLYPGYLAYLSGGQAVLSERAYGRYFLGVFVLAGVLTMMLTLGWFWAAAATALVFVRRIATLDHPPIRHPCPPGQHRWRAATYWHLSI